MGEGEAGNARRGSACCAPAAPPSVAAGPPPAAPKIFKTYGIRNRESVKLMLISADLQIPYSHNEIHTAIISRIDLLQ